LDRKKPKTATKPPSQAPELPGSDAYLAAIVECSDDAIIRKDLRGIMGSFNAGAERMFGYTAAEAIGKSVKMLIPEDRLHEEETIIARLSRGERIDHYETQRLTKDGRLIEVSLTVSPIFNSEGKVAGASKIVRDVTERNRIARELAAQQEWFRITLASIGDGVLSSDEHGCITFMNPVAEILTGWTSDEAKGRPLGDVFRIVHEQTREQASNPAEKVLRTGAIMGLANHTLLIARNGTERPIADSAAPITDAAGKIVGVVLVFRDVSERRREDLERINAVTERERLLASERAAREEAEKANRIKDEFIAMVSHELRTPLNAILGWTELLLQTPDDQEMLRHGLDVVARNTRAQTRLISDLLDVSRISAGKLHLELESVNLTMLVESCIETVQGAAGAAKVSLHTNLDRSIGRLVADPQRLQQILWNLLSNAIKFTPEGGEVIVETKQEGDHVVMTVADNGLGIGPTDLKTVFERFRARGPHTTRGYGGLGLGLAISKHLVELHGGRIWASSDGPGRGALFTVTLPLKSDLPAHALVLPRAPSRPAKVSLAGVKLLIVENEPDAVELLRRVLTMHGAVVASAASALEALALLPEFRPHVIVSDIGLSGIDGYGLMENIRRRGDELGRIPGIALTAFARQEDRTRALRAGYQAHLAKPMNMDELIATIKSFADVMIAKTPQ
jgi:PAS domain S-box-containing protein